MYLITALELFTHPQDLEVTVGRSEKDGKHYVLVTRGPGHSFKLMVSSPAPFETREGAIESIRNLLEGACEAAKRELTNPDNITAQIVNPDNLPADDMDSLTAEHIDWIVNELTAGRAASTFKRHQVPI